jgi:hypothetical protein
VHMRRLADMDDAGLKSYWDQHCAIETVEDPIPCP